MMNIGPLGLELLTHFEGFESRAYQDVAKVWTIGYGTTRINGVPVKAGDVCTVGEAMIFLAADLRRFEPTVRSASRVGLLQHEFDALVCFVYNVGPTAFVGSTIARKLLEPSTSGTSHLSEANFVAWNKATINGTLTVVPGLTRRRKAEYHLLSTGTNRFHFE